MNTEMQEIYRALLDLVGLMNTPQRDAALLQAAGVNLDRALFPLLSAIEHRGPVGIVDLADLVGRDYTTVSRQVAKMESLGVIVRRTSKTDKRSTEASITPKGKKMTNALNATRQRIGRRLFSKWARQDRQDLARLLRRFTNDLRDVSF